MTAQQQMQAQARTRGHDAACADLENVETLDDLEWLAKVAAANLSTMPGTAAAAYREGYMARLSAAA